jgi:hypothetical protein
MDVNEWISCECSDEGTYTQNIHNSLLVHMRQKTKIALEIAGKIVSVNGHGLYNVHETQLFHKV